MNENYGIMCLCMRCLCNHLGCMGLCSWKS